jgi:hypothetical protein
MGSGTNLPGKTAMYQVYFSQRYRVFLIKSVTNHGKAALLMVVPAVTGGEMTAETRSVCPQLRPDLIIEQQGQDKTARYIITDPVSGRYFFCGAPQHALLMLFSGHLTTTEIATRYKHADTDSPAP